MLGCWGCATPRHLVVLLVSPDSPRPRAEREWLCSGQRTTPSAMCFDRQEGCWGGWWRKQVSSIVYTGMGTAINHTAHSANTSSLPSLLFNKQVGNNPTLFPCTCCCLHRAAGGGAAAESRQPAARAGARRNNRQPRSCAIAGGWLGLFRNPVKGTAHSLPPAGCSAVNLARATSNIIA